MTCSILSTQCTPSNNLSRGWLPHLLPTAAYKVQNQGMRNNALIQTRVLLLYTKHTTRQQKAQQTNTSTPNKNWPNAQQFACLQPHCAHVPSPMCHTTQFRLSLELFMASRVP